MIHVAFDLSSLTRQKSGVGVYTESLIRHLPDESGGLRISGYSSGRTRPDLHDFRNLVTYRHLPVPTRGLYGAWNSLHMPTIERLVGAVDIFHGTNYVLPPVRNAKRVLTIHDLSFIRCPEWCPPEVVRPYAKNVARFCAEADVVIAVSEFTKRELTDLLDVPESKITVIGEAIEVPSAVSESSRFLERLHSITPYLLFVGTLEKRKNLLGILTAFNELRVDYPHHLVLAGKPGFGWSECAAYIEREGLAERVHVLGYVSDEEKAALYEHADAFLYPSLYEGFGLPILEAFAGGCPVITARRASLPEVAGDAAVYIEGDEAGELADCMRRVLDDAALQAELRERGRRRLESFSWDRAGRETMGVYGSLLS